MKNYKNSRRKGRKEGKGEDLVIKILKIESGVEVRKHTLDFQHNN